MRDPDLERRVEEELLRWADRTGRGVVAPDLEQIHRRAETRTARGIAVTLAATAVAGLLLGAVVVGVGGIGMQDGRPSGRVAARSADTAAGPAPAHRSPTAPVAGAGGRGAAASTPSSRPRTGSTPVPTSAAAPEPEPSRELSPGPTPPAARRTATTPMVQSSAPATTAPTPSMPTPQSRMSATAVGRPPFTLRMAFRSGDHDAQGCRTTWRVDRTVAAATPRTVVRAVLDGPTGAERERGVGSVYGRDGRTTPANIVVDWGRRLVTVDLGSVSSVGISPTACRGREIRGPVLDALGQYDPRWSVRFTVRGDPKAFPRYLNGS